MPLNALQSHDAVRLKTASHLIGIDEAGRGCLAGPVVAGACLLTADFFKHPTAVARSTAIHDSKQLSGTAREAQFDSLKELQGEGLLDFEVAQGSVEEIAELNILGANRLAMQRAVEALIARQVDLELPVHDEDPLFAAGAAKGPSSTSQGPKKVSLIVDGRPLKPWPYQHEGIIKGDGKSLAIAMASIAAKVTRDRQMLELGAAHPYYGFEQHMGYATQAHRAAILAHGPCPQHRALFLRKVLGTDAGT